MEKMLWILVLVGLSSSVCGKPVVERTQTFSLAEENDNITIRLDIQTQTDASLISLVCFFQSKLLKVFYRLINGVEVPESQHQQFAGRVQWDRDTLREGQIRLHVSRVTAEDSGKYWCDLVGYDKTTKRSVLETSEKFVLRVNATSGGNGGDVSFNAADSGPVTPEGSRSPGGNPYKEYVFLAVFMAVQFATAVAALAKLSSSHQQQKDQDQQGGSGTKPSSTVRQQSEVSVDIPDCSRPPE